MTHHEPARVLYIDDDEGLSRLVGRSLERAGFSVTWSPTGADGVGRVAAGETFDVIALDHAMPGQDGLVTLAQLRALPDCPPVVYATGNDDQRTAVAALKAGASDYVVKDVHGEFFDLLRAAVESAANQAQLQRRVAAAQEELQRLNETLETRVAERTRELAEANSRLVDEAAERVRVEAQLLQAQKMEAVGQLTGGTAHDFNNLLTTILGNLELAEGRTDDPAMRKLLAAARRSAERGARLTGQLLALARRQDLRPRGIDLNVLVANAQDLLTRTIDPSVSIIPVLAPDLWPALADPTQMELALLNLAINARDAMPDGGELRIETRNLAALAPDRPADLPTDGPCVALAVRDTGCGMPPDIKARVFEPFFTTKEIGRGSGLGLSMVWGVVRQLGGTVTIDSAPGAGTSVTLFLPRADAVTAEPSSVSAARSVNGRGRLLLVDDDDDVREITAEGLRDQGFSVTEVEGGEAALALLDGGTTVDAVVTDLAMPRMRGSALAEAVLQRNPAMPVVMVTGYGDAMALDPRVVMVRKPFRAAELARVIDERMRTA